MKYLEDLKSADAIRIYLASSDEILTWSFGEVTKPETINYRTFKAEREGLFDERIFGPVKNFECYCGKYKGIRYKGVICDKCGVEITHSRVRRERLGHIRLATPVAHVWFFRSIPSKLALLLDISPRNVESVIYFSAFIITQVDGTKKAAAISKVDEDLSVVLKGMEKDNESQIHSLEAEMNALSKNKDALKAQEAQLKLKQKIQTLKNNFDKNIEEVSKNYKLIQKKLESIEEGSILSDNEYINLINYLDFCKAEIGAEAIKGILQALDLNAISLELKKELETSKGQKAVKIAKRLKVVEQFRRSNISPDRMIMDVVPVIPPDLRPLVQLDGGKFASSDLNELYRRVINRNNRLRRLLDLGAPEIIIRNEKRMLQESVDGLFDSSKQRQKARVTKGKKELRSLTDMLKGKQGVFRLNLLGKRVDYSGRGVIINGPDLKLNECGIPKEMALELFKPFVLRELLLRGFAPNVKSAKYVLESRGSEIWDILEDLVKDHPVLLNRAPTLWRLGIQAFYPKLIEGNAIRLHLCVCAGFNADYDGDQMAVHLPLSEAAKEEARKSLISTNNLLNPANGSPMSVPTKIILYGIYYMTSVDETLPKLDKVFADVTELRYATQLNFVNYRQLVKLQLNGEIIETTPGRVIFNSIVPNSFGYINDTMDKKKVNSLLATAFDKEPQADVVALIDNLKNFGLTYGTVSGQSVSLADIEVPASRNEYIEKGYSLVSDVQRNYKRGLITKSEVQRLTEDVWNQITAEIDTAVWNNLADTNPVKVLVKSGSTRASRDQVKQVAGIVGLMSDPTGKIVQLPILGNYKTGLTGLEYFVSARGARKGLVDKGLKTADAGYLTRRLVDVAQDIIVKEQDCGTERGLEMKVGEGTVLQGFADRVTGRIVAQDVKDGKRVIVSAGTILTKELALEIEKAGVASISLRSPVTCETRRGVCAKCYGIDLMTRNLVAVGVPVGVAAAQAIGEPGTQLTLRTFHTGGITGKDITQGLPRVEEVVEARAPKYLSIMSEITGTVKISKSGDERKITIIASEPSEETQVVDYAIDPVAEITVQDGRLVAKGEKLTAGHLDLSELFRTLGIDETKRYIISEIQKVYASQGVVLNDKHIEVIVKQMFNHVRIEDIGDTAFLVSEVVTKASFEEENERVLAEGGVPATAKATLLGITKASLTTDSFLSAASFIQTSGVLTDAAVSGRVDRLLGLKESVILGKLIPTGERVIN